MTPTAVNQLICAVRWTNGILQIIDQHKNNPAMTLGEIHAQFESLFGVNPNRSWFSFYNQDQLLTSLLAYLCLPSEKFHERLPKTSIKELDPKWGLSRAAEQIGDASLFSLIKFMRNAVSHGHVEIVEDLLYKFGGLDPKSRNKKIKMFCIHGPELSRFCQALNYWCLTQDVSLGGLKSEMQHPPSGEVHSCKPVRDTASYTLKNA